MGPSLLPRVHKSLGPRNPFWAQRIDQCPDCVLPSSETSRQRATYNVLRPMPLAWASGCLGRLCWRGSPVSFFVGFLSFSTLHRNFTGASPECHQNVCHRNVTGMSPECHQNFTGASPECRRNIESEHLNKGDNHNSAFPQ